MAEIPGDYSHIHRSIDQLRSMNERGVLQLGPMSTTDIRASLMHDYKPFNISDLRNHGIDRLDYNKLANGIDLVGRGNNDVNNTNNNNNNNNNSNARNNVDIGRHEQHQSHQQEQKAYSSPSTPPTPISNNDGQMTETKVNIDLFTFAAIPFLSSIFLNWIPFFFFSLVSNSRLKHFYVMSITILSKLKVKNFHWKKKLN